MTLFKLCNTGDMSLEDELKADAEILDGDDSGSDSDSDCEYDDVAIAKSYHDKYIEYSNSDDEDDINDNQNAGATSASINSVQQSNGNRVALIQSTTSISHNNNGKKSSGSIVSLTLYKSTNTDGMNISSNDSDVIDVTNTKQQLSSVDNITTTHQIAL
jgi:hypothetical protein